MVKLGLTFMWSSESQLGDVMDPKSQSLSSLLSCTAANGREGPKQPSGNPETALGDVRPKPPVKPKPCVLPKPAMPTKPSPGLRQSLPEVPSAEKINFLAGPKPYSSGAGNAVKRLSFSLNKCPPKEATNGKEAQHLFPTPVKPSGEEEAGTAKKSSAADGTSGEECDESSSIRKGAVPFKVKPVALVAKPERFPGTTVEEILAKIDKPIKVEPNNPDKPRLVRSFFSQDGSTAVQLGPKGYAAFRRYSSGGEGAGTEPEDPTCRVSDEVEESCLSRNKEETASSNGQHVPESEQPARAVERNTDFFFRDSSSSRPSISCDGGRAGHSSPLSPPGTYQPPAALSAGITPGSPDAPPEPAPGAPYLPPDLPSTRTQLPPGSPDAAEPLRSPVQVSLGPAQIPGSPVTLPNLWSPGSPSLIIKTSPGSSPSLEFPDIFPRPSKVSPFPGQSASFVCVPVDHSLETSRLLGVSESPGSPSTPQYHIGSDQPPGSPSRMQDSCLLSQDQDFLKNKEQRATLEDENPQISQLGLRRASEGVVHPRGKKLVREELGGSLSVLPSKGGPLIEQTAAGESNWSLSQSFEWSFPSRPPELGGRRLGSPPQSPIQEADDTGLLETELGRKSPRLERMHDEPGLEGQGRSGKEAEAYRTSSCPSVPKDSLEFPSVLGVSAPGGPSVQEEHSSHKLISPILAEEIDFEEKREDFLPLAPTHGEGALRVMESLPSVEQAALSAEPCIFFSEDTQVQMAASCQEDNSVLTRAQEGKAENVDLLRAADPEPGSHWLDELLASPPPSADDTKRRGKSKPEEPTGPEDLLGWSRKDLCSEFGIVGTNRPATYGMGWAADVSKVDWPSETEQDREFGTGVQDWPNSYSIGDPKRQDMEFGAMQQDWTTGTPLLVSSNPRQEDWLNTYSSSHTEEQIKESDWSSSYSISSEECQDREPYVRKPGWPKLCSAEDDQSNSEFATEKTSWSREYGSGGSEETAWPKKCGIEATSYPELEMNNKSPADSHQDTELRTDDHRASSHRATFSASESVWLSESTDGSADQMQREFGTHQLDQPSEQPDSQVRTHQHTWPSTYSFDGRGSQDSELNAKVSDWPNRYDKGVSQGHTGDLNAEKPDGASEYDDLRAGWEREVDNGNRSNTTKSETDNQEFCVQNSVWADDYKLKETDAQDSDFSANTIIVDKDTDLSRTEQKKEFGAIEKAQPCSFGQLDLPGERVMMDVEEMGDSVIDLGENLRTVARAEFRGIGEGQSKWAQDLGLTYMDLSSDLKIQKPDVSEKSTEKELHWFPSLGLETLTVSSEAMDTREPGVGQADIPYRSSAENMDVSDLRPNTLDGAEKVGPDQMDWTGAVEQKHKDTSYHYGAIDLECDTTQCQGETEDSAMRRCHTQRLSSPSCLLEEMISNKEVAQQKRPISFPSCHSEEGMKLSNLPDEKVPVTEEIRLKVPPLPAVDDENILSIVDGGDSKFQSGDENLPHLESKSQSHSEQNESQAVEPVSREDQAIAVAREDFIFLEDTEVLDSTAYRDRANLGRKRGHRAPATRSGSALSESDRNSWMFKDSTEPQTASAASDEEVHEEPRIRKSRNSPLTKGVKVPLFPGLSPSALKAKLRGRNRSAEEVDPQIESKEAPVQRSKSCKIANVSGKPLVLPPKPEKSSGSETSSPNWLQVLKLKKKK
uniref:Tankyrase 1 binding protein 1 n=1 Tax=Anolis carolinensis TaxID=28377 RepID=G1KGS6_ANOCA|nr:PREDICTED: 182 kDa tankyrase-1-binding protein isoform X1 [Anolis carolinensis]|eukprot:XP_008109384.1 PREDICTED: 182 kDa tankyrase-1-binding protein isoform X1 [Anolis carolinensis]